MGEKEEFFTLTSIKKCPICGGDLERGYMGAPVAVPWWIPKKRKFVEMAWPWDWRYYFFVAVNIPALRCKKCNIVIADFNLENIARAETPKAFLKKCVKCGKEIPIAALECPYCGAEQKEES
ncbi:MAG: PF20097 family protein [Candidatus Bathyarchaeia archaeon]